MAGTVLTATGRRGGVATVVIAAVIAGSLGGCAAGAATSSQQTTTTGHGEVRLQGTITQDGCDQSKSHIAIGDVGCSIAVNGYDVSVIPGNIRLLHTPGTVTGLDGSTDQTGQHADVYAQLIGPHSATILSAAKYYVRISG